MSNDATVDIVNPPEEIWIGNISGIPWNSAVRKNEQPQLNPTYVRLDLYAAAQQRIRELEQKLERHEPCGCGSGKKNAEN